MPIGGPPPQGTAPPTFPPGGPAIAAALAPPAQIGALSELATATADAAGAARLAFSPPPGDQVWTGTLSASLPGTYVVDVAGTPWGPPWSGASPFGHVQARPGQIVSIDATGLSPGASVSISWLGIVTDTQAPPAGPAPASSQITVLGGTLEATIPGTVTISGSITGNVAIVGTPTVSISGTPTVSIGNTPSVTVSGTPTVNISAGQVVQITNTPSGSITVAGTVTIGNTPSVTISGTPTVNISAGQVVQITNTAGGSVTVAGTVAIGNTPSVTITGTPAVSITGTPTVNIGNTPAVSITGTPTVSVSSGSVSISTGTVNVQNVAGTALAVVSAIDQYNPGNILAGPGAVTTALGPAVNPYAGVAVWMPSNVEMAFSISNTTKGITAPFQTSMVNGGSSRQLLVFAVPFDAGDAMSLITKTGYSVGAGHVFPLVYGLASIPPNSPELSPDGLLPVVGAHAAQVAGASTNTTLVAAPTAGAVTGYALLVKQLLLQATPTALGNTASIFGTIGGTPVTLLTAGAANGTPDRQTRDFGKRGALIDAGIALGLNALGTSTLATALYDVVALS